MCSPSIFFVTNLFQSILSFVVYINYVVLDDYLIISKEKTKEMKEFVKVQDCYGFDSFIMSITSFRPDLNSVI